MARARRRRPMQPQRSMNFYVIMTGTFVAGIMLLVGLSFSKRSNAGAVQMYQNARDVPKASLDAILVLGGGVPTSLYEPPLYVQERCDQAASISQNRIPILCLSAGTAHLPQRMNANGLPLWEATSSAAYLQQRHGISNVYVETTSYDTIGNAFFARTSHCQVAGWRKLLIVTSEFHMERTKAIFDWIFGVDNGNFQLSYLATANTGLSASAVEARLERERQSLASVQQLSRQYRSLKGVWQFLNEKHSLYAAKELIASAAAKGDSGASDMVKKSYGLH